MIDRVRRLSGVVGVACLCLAGLYLSLKSSQASVHTVARPPAPEKIVQYLRERFTVADTVKMSIGPYREAFDPNFREATVTIDDGKQRQDRNVWISKDGHYLIWGQALPLGTGNVADLAGFVRHHFNLPPTVQVKAGAIGKSAFPGFNEVTVTVDDGKGKKSQNFFLSQDDRTFIWGNIFNFTADPAGDVLRNISLQNQPSEGPANAPVTLVEYSDLQCPTCARLQEFLNDTVLPKYGNKVRVVFKEFPLPVHDWSMTGAIASQCAYRINPGAFAAYRSLIFKNQNGINATNARDMLLSLASQAGIDRLKLATCLDSKTSLPRVLQNVHEGQAIGVVFTPTTFINGKRVVGTATPEAFFQAIDEALRPRR